MEYVSGKCWLVVVQGDSMRDYDLHEGDRLLVRTQDVARSGEIVVAHYDGGPTVKTGSVEKYWGCFFCFIVFCIFAL